MKISVADEKKRVEEQRRILEENIADFQVHEKTLPFPKYMLLKTKKIYLQRRKAQFEAERMGGGGSHHTLTLGKLGKKK